MQYDVAGRALHAEITPQPGRTVPEIRFRARDPEGGRIDTVQCVAASGRPMTVTPQGDLLRIRDVDEPARVNVHFE